MTDHRSFPERLYAAGFVDLIPVVPPGAPLAPTSKLEPSSLGKSPGVRLGNGLWAGTNWRAIETTAEDVRTWVQWKANFGLRSDFFPGVDIDCADPALAQVIEDAAIAALGPAPVRIGNPPKRLLPYRLEGDPFGRMRLLIKKDAKTSYLVEILAQGQQYLVAGIHPSTGRAYEWSQDPAELGATGLTPITREAADRFLEQTKASLEMLGYECHRVGDGSPVARAVALDQRGLEAPSMEELRRVVELIPNSLDLFPGWDEYVRMLYAVRAAAGAEEIEGHEIFAAWAARWEGHGMRHAESWNPDEVHSLWRRTKGPFVLGFSWLAEMARQYGYNDAPFDTQGEVPAPSPTEAEESERAPYLSDQWLALKVVEACHPILRYAPALEKWLVWTGSRWQPDAEMLADDTIKGELRHLANGIDGKGGDNREVARNTAEARLICSGGKVAAVRALVQSDRAIAVSPENLDADSWLLNTPAGVVDLKTGRMLPPDPDQLCTKSTAVAPDFDAPHPEWDRFLAEATGGNAELRKYLQRLAGYALTGSTIEQQYAFLYGTGGNGKGVFVTAISGVLGDYAKDAPMDTFVASQNDRHATELASLQGARLVTASETEAGKRWDEAKLKRLTGGDPITARFMRQDFFTYQPQFKLLFLGNHKPEIRNLDPAMARRTHLVPFTVQPAVVDKELGAKLKKEWPAILAWMIRGCLAWQKEGLAPPPIVLDATAEYFDESDPTGQWLAENTEPAEDEWVGLLELWDNWLEWANRRQLYRGGMQRLAQVLASKKYVKRKHPKTRRIEFAGLKIVNRQDPMEGLSA